MKRQLINAAIAASLWMATPTASATASDGAQKTAVCAGCHGSEGRSQVPDNPILAGQHADYLGNALRAYISGERDNGIMKTMAERLSAEDMEAIIAYYAAQSPYQSPAQPTGDAARGEGKTAVCVACHGANGRSASAMFPNLAGQHAVYLSKGLRAYRSGERSGTIMPSAITESLSDQDIEDIAAYYSGQSLEASDRQAEEVQP